MSYSRRQLEALGEPFGSCATRVKPGGYGRIYGVGNEPEPEGSRPSGEDYYYQTGTMGSGPYGGQPAGFMVPNPEYKGAEYVPYTGEGVPSGDDYYYNRGSLGAPAGYMVANPEYQADVPAYVPYVAPTTTATSTTTGGGSTTTTTGGGGTTTGSGTTTGGGTTTTTGGGGDTWINAGGDTIFTGNKDQIRDYINQLYLNELKRPADEGGLKFWTDNIAADGKVSQNELNAWRAGATAKGETLYTPTNDEAARRAAEEAARQAAAAEAARLAALRQQQGNINNQGGTAAPPGFLGVRPPFTGVRNPFYEGSDARSDLVNMAYQKLLNRQPDPGGLASYNQEMMRGLTGQGLVSALANSPEFQRTQDFQRAYTSTFRPGYQEFGPSGQYNQPIYLSSYTDYARSPGFIQPQYNTEMMTPQDLGYGFGSFNPFAYGGTNPFAGDTAAPTSEGSPAAASGGRIKDDDGITALLKR